MTPRKRLSRRIIGGVCYITHIFDDVGSELPVHNHADKPQHLHTTLIARGSFELLGARSGSVESGSMIEWQADEDHGLRALTPGAVAVNIRMALPNEKDLETQPGE